MPGAFDFLIGSTKAQRQQDVFAQDDKVRQKTFDRSEVARQRALDVQNRDRGALGRIRSAIGEFVQSNPNASQKDVVSQLFKENREDLVNLDSEKIKEVLGNVFIKGQVVAPGAAIVPPGGSEASFRNDTTELQNLKGTVDLANLTPDEAHAVYAAALEKENESGSTENERLIARLTPKMGLDRATDLVQFTKITQFTDPITRTTKSLMVNMRTQQRYVLTDQGLEEVKFQATDEEGNPQDPASFEEGGGSGTAASFPPAFTPTSDKNQTRLAEGDPDSRAIRTISAVGPVASILDTMANVFGNFNPETVNEAVSKGRAAMAAYDRDVVLYGKAINDGRESNKFIDLSLAQSASASFFTSQENTIRDMMEFRVQVTEQRVADLQISQNRNIEPKLIAKARSRVQAADKMLVSIGSQESLEAVLEKIKRGKVGPNFQAVQNALSAAAGSVEKATSESARIIEDKVFKAILRKAQAGQTPTAEDAKAIETMSRKQINELIQATRQAKERGRTK